MQFLIGNVYCLSVRTVRYADFNGPLWKAIEKERQAICVSAFFIPSMDENEVYMHIRKPIINSIELWKHNILSIEEDDDKKSTKQRVARKPEERVARKPGKKITCSNQQARA